MTILNATEARSKLYSLIDEATETHQPVVITGKRGNAVLVSEEDWNAISETLHLLSVPGMRDLRPKLRYFNMSLSVLVTRSCMVWILAALRQFEDLTESSKELDW